jgi:hypothetical protein
MLWDSFPACQLADVPAALLQDVDVIGIDEGQFFPDLLEWCEEQMNKHHRMIVIAALDGTFQRAPFGKVLNVSSNEKAFFFFFSCRLAIFFFFFSRFFPTSHFFFERGRSFLCVIRSRNCLPFA